MMSGHIERLEQADGFVLVSGWLQADRALLATTPPLLLLHSAEGMAESHPLRRLYPWPVPPLTADQPPRLGFEVLFACHLPGGAMTASMRIGGQDVPLGNTPILPLRFHCRGALEAPGPRGISGWVFDLPGHVPDLLVDGRITLPLPLDQPCPDLLFDTGDPEACLGFHLALDRLGALLRGFEPDFALLDGAPHSLTLLSGGTELGRQVVRLQRRMDGMIERIVEGQATGWATEAELLGQQPEVEVVLDGTRWNTVPATIWRGDLAANGVGTKLAGGAFHVELPPRGLTGAAEARVELRPAHAAKPLAGASNLKPLGPWRPDHPSLLDLLPPDGGPGICIIVPIHNAVEDVGRCIEAVLRHTTGRARLLLIDDASTDPGIAELFLGWEGLQGVELHHQAQNLGFTATCNHGFALAGRDDVVLLNSDTQVGPGWLDGLRLAAHASARIGTVTAVSNNAGVFSVPEMDVENHLPAWFSVADMARLVRQAALGLWPSVPTGGGFCLYIRRVCLDVVGGFDEVAFPRGYGEENDFCMRATAAGFEHRVDDRSWVWHRRSASFGQAKSAHMVASHAVLVARYPEYDVLTGLFRNDATLLAMRWRVRRALQQALAGACHPRPRLLFVISTESGGTPQTNRDLMEALADRYEPWLLRSTGRVVEVTRHGAAEPEEIYHLERPIEPATHGSAEYDRYLAGLLLRHGFELVHIRHLAWHGIGLPRVCRTLGIPVVFSFHDFYTLCPTVKLLDGEGRFCGGRCTQGEADCVPELWPAHAMPPLRDRFVHRWRAAMSAALDLCDAFVTTSPGTQQTLLDGLPMLAGRDFRLIPHGRSFARLISLAADPTPEEPLRILVPGNISAAKGATIIAALAALDTERAIEFHVLGAVDGNLAAPRAGLVLHGRYEREAFAERATAINPHLAVILSTWPETYCHTLTECWSVGLPVFGSAIGAVGERIGADGGGWLIDPAMEPAQILERLLRLKRDVADLRGRREEVRRWQRRTGRHYDNAAMAVSYDLLYRDLLQRRRSFAEARPEAPPIVALTVGVGSGSVGFHLPLPLRNDTARGVVFRSVSPTYPFGDPEAGLADMVLIGDGAAKSRDLAGIATRCQMAKLPMCVETDAGARGGAARAALAAAGAGFLTSTALGAAALRRGGLLAEVLPAVLEPAQWRRPITAAVDLPPHQASCRLLGFADDPGLEGLRSVLEDLRQLAVADLLLVGAGGLPLGADPLARLRAIAAICDLALVPLALGADEPGILALRAAGLVVLRNRIGAELLGETADGDLVLPAEPRAWLRAIAELSADAPRRRAMARRGRQATTACMARDGQEQPFDQVLRQVVARGLITRKRN